MFFWGEVRQRLPYRRYLDLTDRARRLRAAALSLLTLALGSVYLLWIGRLVLETRQPQEFAFVSAETLSFLLISLLALDVWHLRGHRPEGMENMDNFPANFFIRCRGEPLEVAMTTLGAGKQI
ncbi:MAG: hypothetical protein A3K23_00560 [Desulfobacca sp. RBG_16_58_9]|nr:MAG: hypothetical protein A3K23_00560 [Desulfobacca sp. RBG_16_58_9]